MRGTLSLAFLLTLISSTGCTHTQSNKKPVNQENTPIDSVFYGITIDSAAIIDTAFYYLQHEMPGTYENTKNYCLLKRSEWFKKYNQTDSTHRDSLLTLVQQDVENLLLNRLFHHWYGTEWDFNGYTATPKKGKIACGYFVSTTLLHMGFNLNRYKMAQQTGLSGAHTLRFDEKITYFKNEDTDITRQKILSELADGLYFAGLSFHVGYLLIRKGEVFFIHSDYIDTEGVKIEKLNYSKAFAQTTGCYVVPVSTNKTLLEKWIRNDSIPIITDKDLR